MYSVERMYGDWLSTIFDWVLCDWITVDNQFGRGNENENDA